MGTLITIIFWGFIAFIIFKAYEIYDDFKMASYLREDRLKSLKQEKPRAHQFMDSWGRIIKVSEEEHKKFIEEDIAELERGMETRKKESRLIDWTIFIFILGCIFGSSF